MKKSLVLNDCEEHSSSVDPHRMGWKKQICIVSRQRHAEVDWSKSHPVLTKHTFLLYSYPLKTSIKWFQIEKQQQQKDADI